MFQRAFIALTVAAATLVGCAESFTPEESGYWLNRLEDETTRIEALKNLGKFSEPAVVDAVITWLEQKGDWQPDAAYTLGELGDVRAIPNLIAAIDYAGAPGKSARSRRINKTNINAARALAMLKTDAALDPIMRLTNSSDQNTVQAALESLGKLGNQGAVKTLADFASTASHPFIRKTAVIALGKVGSAEAVAPLIVALYQELPGVSFYLEARQALVEVGPIAIPALLETLDRKNKAVEAVRLTDGQPIAEGAIEGKAAFVLGILRAKDAEAKLSSAATSFYTKFKKDESVFASIPGAVSEIAYALGYIGGDKAQGAVERIVTDTNPNLRIAGAESLVEMGAKNSVKTLAKVAATGSGDQKSIVDALSMLGSTSENKALEALVAKDSTLKSIVDSGLKALAAGGECKTDPTCWKGKLTDTDATVRRRAVRELGWSADQNSLAELLKAAEDTDPRVRIAAHSALVRLKGVDVEKLKSIHEAWSKKSEYRNSNKDLIRTIAVLKHSTQS